MPCTTRTKVGKKIIVLSKFYFFSLSKFPNLFLWHLLLKKFKEWWIVDVKKVLFLYFYFLINNTMQEKIISEGKCLYCGKTFAKSGINRHLMSHLKVMAKSKTEGKSFLIKVETGKRWGVTPYFLSILVDGEASLNRIDQFLRDIWLECCGHLSSFTNPKVRKQKGWLLGSGYDDDDDEFEDDDENDDEDDEDDENDENDEDDVFEYRELYPGEISMKRKVKDELYKGLVLDYEYDFGATTELTITVMDEYPVKADNPITLLSRNEPEVILCSTCGKAPATQICTVCTCNQTEIFCDKCAKKHAKKLGDEDYDSFLPVVNSPRMGECGYSGGIIDIERDTVGGVKK